MGQPAVDPSMSESAVRRAKATLCGGKNPIRQSLQPEAIGAVIRSRHGGNEVVEAFDWRFTNW
jgi:hypothetical protein